jgi:hypothetical protein
MIFMLIGRWRPEAQAEYVQRAEQTLASHSSGYEGVTIIDRYYAIGERMFFSIAEAESGHALMRVVAPYADLVDVQAIPVLRGRDGLGVWMELAGS